MRAGQTLPHMDVYRAPGMRPYTYIYINVCSWIPWTPQEGTDLIPEKSGGGCPPRMKTKTNSISRTKSCRFAQNAAGVAMYNLSFGLFRYSIDHNVNFFAGGIIISSTINPCASTTYCAHVFVYCDCVCLCTVRLKTSFQQCTSVRICLCTVCAQCVNTQRYRHMGLFCL